MLETLSDAFMVDIELLAYGPFHQSQYRAKITPFTLSSSNYENYLYLGMNYASETFLAICYGLHGVWGRSLSIAIRLGYGHDHTSA